jgi:putative protease
MTVHGDFRLNVTNSRSAAVWEEELSDYILSPELTLPRIRDIGGRGRTVVYGRIPLMVTEKCVGKEIGDCRSCEAGKNLLTDRRGVRFPLLREYPHRTLICNSRPTYMGDRRDLLLAAGITHEHFLFTDETQKAAVEALFRYREGLAPLGDCRRISKD